MAFPTVDQNHVDASALELLSQLLSDGKKAPLYKVIVEEKKLAPNLYSPIVAPRKLPAHLM